MTRFTSWTRIFRSNKNAGLLSLPAALIGMLGSGTANAQSSPPVPPTPVAGSLADYGQNHPLPQPEKATPLGAAGPVSRAEPFALTLKAGAAYDSNVAISQINTSSGLSDSLVNLGASASYKLLNTPARSLSVGYDFSQSLHSTLSQYDIQLHGVSLNGSVRIKKTTLGLSYSFNHILLAGKPFLDMHFISPSILAPITPKIYARASITYFDESFLTDHRRDARHTQPGLQLFYFFNHAHSFVLLGGNYQRETTAGAEYSYKGYALSASMTTPLKLLKRVGKIKADYEWVSRDYDNITPSIGVKRFDRASTYRLSAELPIVKRLSLGIEARHVSRSSNVQFANLSENVAGAELIFRF